MQQLNVQIPGNEKTVFLCYLVFDIAESNTQTQKTTTPGFRSSSVSFLSDKPVQSYFEPDQYGFVLAGAETNIREYNGWYWAL